MARSRSGGLISMWDPNSFIIDDKWCNVAFIIVTRYWRNTVGDCNMINVYGPKDSLVKAILWNRIGDFMHQHADVVKALPDVRVTAIDHFLSLPGYFVIQLMKLSKTELPKLKEHNFGRKLLSHEKFRILKARIKQRHSETKTFDRVTKHDNLQLIKSMEENIEAGFANDDGRDSRINFLQEDSNVYFPLFVNSSGLCALDRDSLETHVSLDKVKNVVWDCGSSKAPGPDGFSFAFVKNNGMILNLTFWSVHCKIIAKILANRLSKVIDKIVSHEQSAFIAGHQILNGPLIFSEIVEWFKKKLLISKVNFEKAFDLIKACLSSSRALVLVNGSPTSEFSIKRGLMQGDPLSPFLFILVTEGLHNALFNANANDLDNIIRILQVFYLALGLKSNIQKSNVYGIEVLDVDVSSIATNSGCASGYFPFTYLGLPIGSNMSLTSS
nr:putative RNA-directed DNA polymerase, eukaryota, reverse transcriptase zinc-binding domain protein [Tanacetum cinerariifolium]